MDDLKAMDVLKSAGHPSEVLALVKFSLGYGKQVLPKFDFVSFNSMSFMWYGEIVLSQLQ